MSRWEFPTLLLLKMSPGKMDSCRRITRSYVLELSTTSMSRTRAGSPSRKVKLRSTVSPRTLRNGSMVA